MPALVWRCSPGLWVLGRVACLISALVPAWCGIVVDVSFPVVLAGVVAREIVAGRNWRNLPMIAPLVVLGAASLLMHLEAAGLPCPRGWAGGSVSPPCSC